MASKCTLIREIKKRIPKGRPVFLDGRYEDLSGRLYLWWSVFKEAGILWVEFEPDDGFGRSFQTAENFDAEVLENILTCMTDN